MIWEFQISSPSATNQADEANDKTKAGLGKLLVYAGSLSQHSGTSLFCFVLDNLAMRIVRAPTTTAAHEPIYLVELNEESLLRRDASGGINVMSGADFLGQVKAADMPNSLSMTAR